jgi:hypothetical protein
MALLDAPDGREGDASRRRYFQLGKIPRVPNLA